MSRSLEEVLAALADVQDELLATPDDDFAARAALSNRQDALRLEASRARSSLPRDLTIEQLEEQIDHLEAEILQHLDTRPSASAAGQTGRGGGIDPEYLHKMHAQMAKSFGLDQKQEQLQQLKVRLAELRGE